MSPTQVIIIWMFLVLIICVIGTLLVYLKFKKSKRVIFEKIELAEKELLQDFEDVKLFEVMQTKAGNDLINLLISENPNLSLHSSHKSLSEIIVAAKSKDFRIDSKKTLTTNKLDLINTASALREVELKQLSVEKRMVYSELSEDLVKKMALSKEMEKERLEILEQKIKLLGSVFETVSKEKIISTMHENPDSVKEIINAVKNLPEIHSKITSLMENASLFSDEIPDSLKDSRAQLLSQLLSLVNEIEVQSAELKPQIEKAESKKES